MPFYEFECAKGHVTERLVPIGTKIVECEQCRPADYHERLACAAPVAAHRILSPTPTTFVAAGGRKL